MCETVTEYGGAIAATSTLNSDGDSSDMQHKRTMMKNPAPLTRQKYAICKKNGHTIILKLEAGSPFLGYQISYGCLEFPKVFFETLHRRSHFEALLADVALQILPESA